MRHDRTFVAVIGLLAVSAHAGEIEITTSGRLHLDYAVRDADRAPFQDNFVVRRAQFGLKAKIEDWAAKIGYGFTGNGRVRLTGKSGFKDAYVRYEGWKAGVFTIGQFKVPFGLEHLVSTDDITFIERALPTAAFAQSRRLGLGFDSAGHHYTWAAMAFGESIGSSGGQGAAARFTFSPIDHDSNLVHLGLSVTTERPKGRVGFSARPESLPTDPHLVKTGKLDNVSCINQLGLEGAWKTGPYSIQMEWMRSHLSRSSGQPEVNFQGWYVAGSWVLTGESRGYHDGVFKGITPSKASGAWELTARDSHINLNDNRVRGGVENNLTLGLNWYANDHLRIMANAIKVRSERRGITDNPSIFEVRAQIMF